MSFVQGVSENKMKTLVLDVFEYRDKLSKIIGDLEKDYYNCAHYYQGEDGDAWAKKIKKNITLLKNALETVKQYANVLEEVLQKYKAMSMQATTYFDKK